MLIGRLSANTLPLRTNPAAARTRSGVRKLIVPISSCSPNTPQAAPGGAPGRTGSSSYRGTRGPVWRRAGADVFRAPALARDFAVARGFALRAVGLILRPGFLALGLAIASSWLELRFCRCGPTII